MIDPTMRASRRWESFQGASGRLNLLGDRELGDDLQPRIARALLQLAQIGAVDGHECGEVDGLGSFWLAGRQAQARQIQFAVLGVPIRNDTRQHIGSDRAQSRDHLSCLTEPAHMCVAGGEKAMRLQEAWVPKTQSIIR
jgi:hypothetical protein